MVREPFFKIDPQGEQFLWLQWETLVRAYEAKRVVGERWFDRLVKSYSAKGRAYHNLSHIWALLNLSNSLHDHIENHYAVRFAIWFHDAVYNTRRHDNEELSAEMALECLKEFGVIAETTEVVREMILATKDHRGGANHDLNIFLDLDLSILGSKEEVYRHYSAAIRREYWWAPGFLFRQGRKKVLESFLERDTIYFTKELAQRFELQARHNLKNEIESLNAK